MRTSTNLSLTIAVVALALIGCVGSPEDWPKWGGPRGEFTASTSTLLGDWNVAKPALAWSRELGEGYSGMIVVDGRVFTMYSEDGSEIAISLDANTGETLWERSYKAPILDGMAMENGAGPHSTPSYAHGGVHTMGVTGILHRLDAETGEVVWVRRCIEEFGGSVLGRGYSTQPVVYKDTIVTPVGGEGNGVVAFRLSDGEVQWKSGSFRTSHAAPVIVSLHGQCTFVFFAHQEFTGIDPASGAILWRHPHHVVGGHICSTPVELSDDALFFSTAYDGGSWRIDVSRQLDGNPFVVKKRWFKKTLLVHHSNAVHLDGAIFAPSGSFGPKIYSCMDVATGEILWKSRELGRCNVVRVGHRIIALDEEGQLVLARISRESLKILGRHKLFDERAWTPPTLVGKRLFVRNRTHILAVDLP